MEEGKKLQREKIGGSGYINKNCWLIKTLNYNAYKRCQYCTLKFHNCLFLHYQIISLILILFFLTFSFFIEGKNSKLVVISVFTLVIVYGYFFNKSTDKLIKANFAQRKTQEALEELTETLQQKVAEQTKELRKSYEELKILDSVKSEFVSIASHQLRTPLTAVKGYISMIIEGTYGKLSEKLEKPLENIYQSNERLIKLVNELLNLSKLETGKLEFKPEPTSLEKIISDAVEELKINAVNKGLYIRIVKPPKLLPKTMVDQDKLKQVTLNIIDNAIKYTKKGGITIELKKLDSREQIKISDTGEGMDKKEIKSLFQMFSRATAGTQLHREGAGIGLYVAKKFVDMHNGKIWAESPGKGKGSTFYIELLLRDPAP